MTAAAATGYVREMVAREQREVGGLERAMRSISSRYGLGFWQVSHLRKGNAKTIEASLFARIHAAYLDYCEREIKRLEHTIRVEKAKAPDADWTDLEGQVRSLAAEVVQKKRKVT